MSSAVASGILPAVSPLPAALGGAKLAAALVSLLISHSKRLWNNLTPEERKEFFELITPNDSDWVKWMELPVPGKGGRTIRIPVVSRDYIKRYLGQLSKEDKDRLWALIKKANSGEPVPATDGEPLPES